MLQILKKCCCLLLAAACCCLLLLAAACCCCCWETALIVVAFAFYGCACLERILIKSFKYSLIRHAQAVAPKQPKTSAAGMHLACRRGDLKSVQRFLLQDPAHANDRSASSLIILGVRFVCAKALQLCRASIAVDVCCRDDIGCTPLMKAAAGGHVGVAQILISRCARLSLKLMLKL